MPSAQTEGRRRFGNVREFPSGRWQARYKRDGAVHVAPSSFPSCRAAEKWLVQIEAQILRGEWVDPSIARIRFSDYIDDWMRERELKARTREEYDRHLRLHVRPFLGSRALIDITPQRSGPGVPSS